MPSAETSARSGFFPLATRVRSPLPFLAVAIVLSGCDREAPRKTTAEDTVSPTGTAATASEPSPRFRNVETVVEYVGDDACARCHEEEASAYRAGPMASSFHRWTPETRIETPFEEPIEHGPTGFHYAVVEIDGTPYQEEFLLGPDGRRLHELRRRMDWVIGSGRIARTYFTEENGRLFQLPLTWYRQGGWDFSPGYEIDNPRFGRLLPDRCLACHGSYPEPIPHLDGKYAELPPGIGCERCHGPGALHVREREAGTAPQGEAGTTPEREHDDTIVDPARLPIERRLDVCEQCHVHTPVTVFRERRDPFDYVPSERLADHVAFFRMAGSIDIVSHADRLRQSACFAATRASDRPLECATCHDPHGPPPAATTRDAPCRGCHAAAVLEARLSGSPARADHGAAAHCVGCHMPSTKERTVPHGAFTDHWIRVVDADSAAAAAIRPAGDGPLEPYFERDRTGPEAAIYAAMGEIVYGTRAGDADVLREASEALERALRSDTMRADAHFLLGLAYGRLGRTEGAIGALERSLRAEPDRPQRLHALARAYDRAGRDQDSIARLYERALELQPALAWIRADYARFLAARGRRAEAEAAYRAALAERPSLAVAAFDLGTLLTAGGRLEEAAEAFREAVRLDPELGEALASLLYVRVRGTTVAGARIVGSPLASLPVRDRGPDGLRPRIVAGAAGPMVRFENVPAGASVHVLEPDGTPVWSTSREAGAEPTWDLRTDAGRPVAGGLYRVRVRDPGADASLPTPRSFYVGVVRVGS